MSKEFTWAIDENGKPCKCFARPENRGKGKCNHRFHARPGQTQKEFFKEHNLSSTEKSIFQAEHLETLPYRMSEEEKEDLLEITAKKDLLVDCPDGGYIEVEECLWNDMDKNYFSSITDYSVDEINAVLHGETYVVRESFKDENGKREIGELISPEEYEEKYLNQPNVGTGTVSLNDVAAFKYDFEATSTVYVLPYYMRKGYPGENGEELPSDITNLYQRILTTQSYGRKNSHIYDQKAYEALISDTGEGRFTHRTLSDMFAGKQGIWRKEITGCTIPYTGRCVASPDSSLAYDEVKVPPAILVDIYKPTITNYLREKGFSGSQIQEIAEDAKGKQENVSPVTKKLIQDAIDEGNVRTLINRQPSLHQASLLGMKPIVGDTATVKVNPLIESGMGLDFDGDTLSLIGINSSKISEKVDKELHPDNFRNTPRAQEELNLKPTKDSLWGLHNILKRRN